EREGGFEAAGLNTNQGGRNPHLTPALQSATTRKEDARTLDASFDRCGACSSCAPPWHWCLSSAPASGRWRAGTDASINPRCTARVPRKRPRTKLERC